jgi:2-oxoglutarate dehydrogenase E1 component
MLRRARNGVPAREMRGLPNRDAIVRLARGRGRSGGLPASLGCRGIAAPGLSGVAARACTRWEHMSDLRQFSGPNQGYVLEQHERWLADPSSVDAGWRAFFADFAPPAPQAPGAEASSAGTAAPAVDLRRVIGAHELAEAIRALGHTAARLDPLGGELRPDPALEPSAHGVTEADLAALPASVAIGTTAVDRESRTALEAVARLRGIYAGTVGYEFDHIPDAQERTWLHQSVESGRFRASLPADEKKALLARLSQVEGFERYLHRTFFGQKRFSIEGTDLMVPMLDETIRAAARAGARDVVIGMAHRGRLNVLTHVLGKPYAMMLAGFASAQKTPALLANHNPDEPSGDVKYHMGWRDTRQVEGRQVTVTLSPNPSHLEFVNPVVVGMTRAAQDDTTRAGVPSLDAEAGLAVLIHGDAAFPGQGTVAETLNMSGLRGYAVGGTIHLIANNQIGFTTNPGEDRSTRYASDLAKGFEIPVVHVNADDAEACLAVTRMAHAYRERFHKDFVVDLVGYRRWGHNEGDEPSFTQPTMYEAIRTHPTARETFAARLVAEGVVTQAEADAMLQGVLDELAKTLESLGEGDAHAHAEHEAEPRPRVPTETGVPAETLAGLNDALLRRPEGFQPNARLDKLLQRRRDAMGPDGGIDWGHAESLAFASLLAEGTPVRLSGQDAERGTFSHRHVVLHDAATDTRFNPFTELPGARASFEVHNSPLSEMAVVGFEYGYTVFDPQALVIWEAQFGDFANGAQVMIDQYLAASEQKWGQASGLVLLLPHGYEGQGPEHSSARLERYLQLSAEGNLRVVYPTTAAQYFHLLRRQAGMLGSEARPLVVMSPKSLLRHPLAAARLEELAQGRFQPVLRDEEAERRADQITRLLLCSGKVWVDLVGTGDEQRAERAAIEGIDRVALVRVEELYPFPAAEVEAVVAGFPRLREIVWVQEEPRNMGAWSHLAPRLREVVRGELPVRYVGRPERASPAEGLATRHLAEQNRIVHEALGGAPAAPAGSGQGAAPGGGEKLISKRK